MSVCVVSCSVLKGELLQLRAEGKLDAELVFVSKNFHVDYAQLESNLRRMLEHTKRRFNGRIVLVYGELCLGQSGEMEQLARELGVVRVNALNCIDCQLGGRGRALEADPEQDLMFMGPGMVEFFADMKRNLLQQGMDETAFRELFSGIKGLVLLDTCGNKAKLLEDLSALGMGLEVIEVREVGLGGVLRVVLDAIERG
ncbi:DUF1638 domain-containing protein [Candidatus Bathycorpusculum sp.]|jgi:hypothetical protein|uniref:DUF1638 domain-containing protein n=1 Tax=Candidatus Bathycorpusculum sp. TaxID=2994959 RepID=UPI00282AD348|nr:DUF1638 domain-containing protein [Candidatus Termitimicrobium sp.]MCL2686111.1 DUF1638 domain-containing protein [Candidatus Termitimicrobium sp.]